ncbi:Npun_F5749 family FMN-dependent PPOX-type flavoprotein [Acaryochloris marina]|uniref:Npun_F5749 family FMN-dependent PPOX-type flavoprotein n=1 Tax=Acaryochloris marina TaxID=155978 RepID=UPI001BAF7B6D|nr:Npun_F5749 family FMN-dependent PPOX-type flavoprotein [Acaryochloris marina]QUY45358.1 pyridoxamine 5'-phosphate oxidase family protein [Acaryochloris marina S15]
MIELAPWRSTLSRALHRNRSLVYARYAQLATVQANRPANRTVVFRGFLEDSNTLKFVTDRRSKKVEQIAENPWGALCWYFPKTREQFRISGKLKVVTAIEANSELLHLREVAWLALSEGARSQFAWPHPGQPKSESEASSQESITCKTPLDEFCLLLLTPQEVDHLELREKPHHRCGYTLTANGDWEQHILNP